jgi:hypothetical protein
MNSRATLDPKDILTPDELAARLKADGSTKSRGFAGNTAALRFLVCEWDGT